MVIKETLVICDGCGDNCCGDDRWQTAARIRVGRKADGWTFKKGKDFCKGCSELSKQINA